MGTTRGNKMDVQRRAPVIMAATQRSKINKRFQ